MESILRISDAASLGLHAMMCLAAAAGGAPVPAGRLAADLAVSEAHLAKVLQRLARAGLVASRRGPRGGFSLRPDWQSITLLEIHQAIEGPLAGAPCLLGRPRCDGRACLLGGLLASVHRLVHETFARRTLADILPAAARLAGAGPASRKLKSRGTKSPGRKT